MAFMGKAMTVMAFVAMVALINAADVAAQSTDCGTLLGTMAPCLTYVAGGDPKPSPDCCTAFSNVLKTNVSCLCQALNDNGGIPNLNLTKALALPKECDVAAPPPGTCLVAAPVPSPSPWPGHYPTPAPAPNTGAMFAPSMVAIVSMAALVLMKILN